MMRLLHVADDLPERDPALAQLAAAASQGSLRPAPTTDSGATFSPLPRLEPPLEKWLPRSMASSA